MCSGHDRKFNFITFIAWTSLITSLLLGIASPFEHGAFWPPDLYSFVILFLLALLAGYAIGGAFAWLPLLMALGLSVSAVWLSRRHAGEAGAYTALLFGSMLFGLAHYHTHSTAFVALALVAGWCYGYVYWRTEMFSIRLWCMPWSIPPPPCWAWCWCARAGYCMNMPSMTINPYTSLKPRVTSSRG